MPIALDADPALRAALKEAAATLLAAAQRLRPGSNRNQRTAAARNAAEAATAAAAGKGIAPPPVTGSLVLELLKHWLRLTVSIPVVVAIYCWAVVVGRWRRHRST